MAQGRAFHDSWTLAIQGLLDTLNINQTGTNMTEKSEDKAPIKRQYEYMNMSGRNIFTSMGRCMPGATVRLFVDEAKDYPKLKRI